MGRPRKPRYTPPPGAAAALATFRTWLAEVNAWLLAHRDAIGCFPPSLFPSRMTAEAGAWATGRKGRSPQELTTAWVAAQRLALLRPVAPPLPFLDPALTGTILTLRFGAAVGIRGGQVAYTSDH